jgi:succinyl-CoA:(S)-malate CoA-transferase subunit B
MGRPELAGDGRFGTIGQRDAARAEVDAMVGAWTSSMSRAEVIRRCDEGQVPCGPVFAIDEIVADEQYRARGNIVAVDDPRIGPVKVPAPMPRLTDTPGAVRWLGPSLAAHADVLLAELGLDHDRLAALKAHKVI